MSFTWRSGSPQPRGGRGRRWRRRVQRSTAGGSITRPALGNAFAAPTIARHYRDTYGFAVDAERIVVTTGSSGAFILGFLAMFEPGEPGRGHGARLSALSSHPHGAWLRAGADRDIERNPSCADWRGLVVGLIAGPPLKGVLVGSPPIPREP